MALLSPAQNVNKSKHFDFKYDVVTLDSTYDAMLNPELVKYLERQKGRLDKEMNVVIAHCDESMVSFAPASPLSNFLTDMLLERATAYAPNAVEKCDLALLNFGGIRTSINAGDVKVGHIYGVSPFDNYLVFIKVRGSELRKALSRFTDRKNEPFAGMQMVYRGSHPVKISIQGEPLDDNKIYTMVTLNFIAEGGDNILADVRYEQTFYTNVIFRDFLIKEISRMGAEGKTLTSKMDERVVILPEY